MAIAPTFRIPERRVRTLRIRAADEASARRAAIRLGDALHTASLPATDHGRLVVIRSLALGRIPADASPATLALLIERAVRDAAARARRFDEATAAASDAAVTFPDRATALVQLARRHARREPANLWVWERVVPGWASTRTPGERWRRLLEEAHRTEGAVYTAAEILHQAVEHGALAECLSELPPSLIAQWLKASGWEAPWAEAVATPSVESLSARGRAILQRHAAGHSGSEDQLRGVWLGVMLAVHERPARSASSSLPAQIAGILRGTRGVAAGFRRPAGTVKPRVRVSAGEPKRQQADSNEADVVTRPDASTPAEPEPPGDGERAVADEASLRPELAAPVAAADAESGCAGLLFLIPVLHRLGFAGFLRAHPELIETDFPLRLLHFIGVRAGMGSDDPLAALLIERMDDQARAQSEQFRPSAFPLRKQAAESAPLPGALMGVRSNEAARGAGRSTLNPGVAAQLPLDGNGWMVAWLAAIRGWLRRHGRLNWRTVVRRTGRIRATRLQVDVFFESRQAETGLRRLALDVDPGWVPWLGWIVRVHYEDTHAVHD